MDTPIAAHQKQRLVLAPLTVPGATPFELIEAAAAGGFDAITLSIVAPSPAHTIRPLLGNEPLLREIEHRLAGSGVDVLDAGGIWFHPELEVDTYLLALETAARLGAKHFICAGNDPDEGRALHNFARLCERARPFGLKVILEFIPYCETRTIEDACRIVTGACQVNAGILVDALHLSRSDGSPHQLSAIDPLLLAYCQLCDAPRQRPSADTLAAESRTNRLYPGLGELPLFALLDALPAGIPIGVEAPCSQYAGLSVVERGRLCGIATRAFLGAYRQHVAADRARHGVSFGAAALEARS